MLTSPSCLQVCFAGGFTQLAVYRYTGPRVAAQGEPDSGTLAAQLSSFSRQGRPFQGSRTCGYPLMLPQPSPKLRYSRPRGAHLTPLSPLLSLQPPQLLLAGVPHPARAARRGPGARRGPLHGGRLSAAAALALAILATAAAPHAPAPARPLGRRRSGRAARRPASRGLHSATPGEHPLPRARHRHTKYQLPTNRHGQRLHAWPPGTCAAGSTNGVRGCRARGPALAGPPVRRRAAGRQPPRGRSGGRCGAARAPGGGGARGPHRCHCGEAFGKGPGQSGGPGSLEDGTGRAGGRGEQRRAAGARLIALVSAPGVPDPLHDRGPRQ